MFTRANNFGSPRGAEHHQTYADDERTWGTDL
jgi:hypothetical protein